MTTGAPNTAVTVLMDNSVGENMVLANRSQNRQNTEPPRKQAGISRIGRAVPSSHFTRCGTAIPTKDTGPANAVTQAASTLDSNTRRTLKLFTFSPILAA